MQKYPKYFSEKWIPRLLSVCTSGAQTLQYADDLHNGVVVCGYRLTDMIYSQLREDLSEQFDMLLLASRRFTSEVDDKGLDA